MDFILIISFATLTGFIVGVADFTISDSWVNGSNYLYPNNSWSDNVNVTGNLTISGDARVQGVLLCLANGSHCPATAPEVDPVWHGNSSLVAYLSGSNTFSGFNNFAPSSNISFTSGRVYFYVPVFFSSNVTLTSMNTLDVNGSVIIRDLGGNVIGRWNDTGNGATFYNNGILNSTGDASLDGATLYVASSTNRTGIGTTAPQEKLHVTENTNSRLRLRLDNPNAGSSAATELYTVRDDGLIATFGVGSTTFSTSAFQSAYMFTSVPAGISIYSSSSTGNVSVYTNSTEKLRVTNAGNVGISNTAPAGLLHISSATNNIDAIRIGTLGAIGLTFSNSGLVFGKNVVVDTTSGVAGQMKVLTTLSTGAAAIRMNGNPSGTDNDGIQFHVTGDSLTAGDNFTSEKARITTAGRLGVGIAEPGAMVDAQANDTVNNDLTTVLNLRHVSNSTVQNGIGARLRFVGQDDTGGVVNIGDVNGILTNVSTGNTTGALAFTTRTQAGTVSEKMRITSSGNVGIGTTTPNTTLVVKGTSNITGSNPVTLTIADATNSAAWTDGAQFASLDFSSDDASGTGAGTTRARISAIQEGTGGNLIGLGFYTNAGAGGLLTQKMRIMSSGNIGIMKSNPTTTLDVNGTINATAIKIGAFNVCTSDGTNCPSTAYQSSAAGWTNTTTQTTTTYNVGIGAAPGAWKLDVNHTGTNGVRLYTTDGIGIELAALPSSNQNRILSYNRTANTWEDLFIEHGTGGVGTMFEASGDVGVGTTTPASSAGAARVLQISGTSSASLSLEDQEAAGSDWELYNNGGVLYFYNSTVNHMVLSNNGNLGLGTTAPSFAVSVYKDGTTVSGDFVLQSDFRDAGQTKGIGIGYDSGETVGIISSIGGTSGIAIWTHDGSSWGERVRVNTNGTVTISSLAGTGNDYVCVDASGTLHRQGLPC